MAEPAAMADTDELHPISAEARQSAPLDLSSALTMDPTFIRGKTILITGGASGFGAAFFTAWAAHGATIIIGDVNIMLGRTLVERVKAQTGNNNLYFRPLDVSCWRSQVLFFREAARLSPHGGIDTVVANAGTNDPREAFGFENPQVDYQNAIDPPAPKFKTIDVNLYGVMYTSHLAMHFLPLNPGSKDCSPNAEISDTPRDRHLLFIGSVASLYPLPGQAPYGVSKHGVLALYRSLRITAPINHGMRVNILCPYFVHTPILSVPGRAMLAGSAVANIEDVVSAATRFVADPACIGRSLVVGPKIKIRTPTNEDGHILAGADGLPDIENLFENLMTEEHNGANIQERAIWECYAHDLDDSDLFMRRVIKLTKAAAKLRGKRGFVKDILKLVPSMFRRREKKKLHLDNVPVPGVIRGTAHTA